MKRSEPSEPSEASYAPGEPSYAPGEPSNAPVYLRRHSRKRSAASNTFKKTAAVSVVLVVLTLAAGCGHRAGLDDYRGFAHRAAQAGLWREALDRWRRADELAPDDPDVLNNLAVAHEALGDTLLAQALYERAVALDPDSDELRDNLLAFRKAHPELYPPEETDEED